MFSTTLELLFVARFNVLPMILIEVGQLENNEATMSETVVGSVKETGTS